MSKKVDYNQINEAINKFVDANREVHGSHAYGVGFLSQTLKGIIDEMPIKEQEYYMNLLARNTPAALTVSE